MRHTILYCFLIVLLTSFRSNNQVSDANLNKDAASILYIYNVTQSNTITAIRVTYTNPWHNPMSYTINVTIPAGNNYTLNMGNLSENIYVRLTMTNSFDGSIKITDANDPDDCPWIECGNYSGTYYPSIYFYMYNPLYLFISDYALCTC